MVQQPLCEICIQNGIATVAVVGDHIEPVAGSWMRFRTGRLQSLGAHCHGFTKRLLERDGYVREVGDAVMRRHTTTTPCSVVRLKTRKDEAA
jgi:hypothetical protein